MPSCTHDAPEAPSEFARLALHLIENEYVNGEVVRLDGASRLPFTPEPARL